MQSSVLAYFNSYDDYLVWEIIDGHVKHKTKTSVILAQSGAMPSKEEAAERLDAQLKFLPDGHYTLIIKRHTKANMESWLWHRFRLNGAGTASIGAVATPGQMGSNAIKQAVDTIGMVKELNAGEMSRMEQAIQQRFEIERLKEKNEELIEQINNPPAASMMDEIGRALLPHLGTIIPAIFGRKGPQIAALSVPGGQVSAPIEFDLPENQQMTETQSDSVGQAHQLPDYLSMDITMSKLQELTEILPAGENINDFIIRLVEFAKANPEAIPGLINMLPKINYVNG